MPTSHPKVNGNGHGRPTQRELAAAQLKWSIEDLITNEALRRDCLRQLGKRRAQIYAEARERGIPAKVLRAAVTLRKQERRAAS